MITEPIFYLVALPAVFITGLSKGGFGGGVAFVSVPTMALFVEPLTAAAIMLPILLVMDAISMRVYWRKWLWSQLKILIPATMLGTLIGTFTARFTDPALFRIFLATIAIVFALQLLWKLFFAKDSSGKDVKTWQGWFWGTLGGYSSFFAHSGGPPLNAYLLPQRLEKTAYQATLVMIFTTINWSKIVPYIWLNELHWETFSTALILVPWAIVSIFVGVWLHKKVPERPFYIVCCIGMLLTGAKLAFDGFSTY